MNDTITIEVLINRRDARCDFCSQSNQSCFNSPNAGVNDGDRDICVKCIDLLHTLLHASPIPSA
jgi:hypothetical protein